MRVLADKVAAYLPGWIVHSATLAAPDALEQAMRAAPATVTPMIFPFFLSDGWFIRTVLPRRLAAIGQAGARLATSTLASTTILTPFGLLPATRSLVADTALAACMAQGWHPAQTSLVLAAHGSGVSRQPAEAAVAMRDHLAATTPFSTIRVAFIEEPPLLADVLATEPAQSICLPLFAARWGHVAHDLPEAVRTAHYAGVVLSPIGTHEAVPQLIAAAIAAGN